MDAAPQIIRDEVFDLAYGFVTETSENIFLTGKAGTGKTTFLKYLKEHCTKNMIVAAPTGVAAINAGGVTLHSLFQLPFQPYIPEPFAAEEYLSSIKINKQRRKLLEKMELLVIDEISMVRCDLLDALNALLKRIKRTSLPFGGVQMLFIGDLYQLPPVATRQDWQLLSEYYASTYFFDSQCLKDDDPLQIELTRIYRQREDAFINLLNKVRSNELGDEDFEMLHSRYQPGFRPTADEKYITLTTHNAIADSINTRELGGLLSPAFMYECEVDGDFLPSSYPADAQLKLKRGAQVMFLKNDPEKKFYNGKMGIVSYLDREEVRVKCEDEEIIVEKFTWENQRYSLNRQSGKLETEMLGTFTQFPLRLAWAITIHKSQGLTFEKAIIDAQRSFTGGQVYVALSRCTTLTGIVLNSKIPAHAILTDEKVINGLQRMQIRGLPEQRLEGARRIYLVNVLDKIFSFASITHSMSALHQKVLQNQMRLQSGGMEWCCERSSEVQAMQRTGQKFMIQLESMVNELKRISELDTLQQRLTAAHGHFMPLLTAMIKRIEDHVLITDHKEVSDVIDPALNELYDSLNFAKHLMEAMESNFNLEQFHRKQIGYIPPRKKLSCYAALQEKQTQSSDMGHGGLYQELTQWRNTVCREEQLPVYRVANKKSLAEIAEALPTNEQELLLIHGFGKTKVRKYGSDIFEMVENYLDKGGK